MEGELLEYLRVAVGAEPGQQSRAGSLLQVLGLPFPSSRYHFSLVNILVQGLEPWK